MKKMIERKMEMSLPPLAAIGAIGALLTLGISMNADAGLFGSGGTSWKEEVLLSDNRIIVVERKMLTARGGDEWAINRSGSRPKEYQIRFEHPAGLGKMIEWRSTKIDSQTWPETPLILNIDVGQPVVFSILDISAGCAIYSKYVYRNGVWIEEALPESFEQQATNLLFGSQRDLPSLLKLKEKLNRNSEPGYRKALKRVGPNRKVCG